VADQLPTPPELLTVPTAVGLRPPPPEPQEGLRVRDVWGILVRNKWLLLASVVCLTGGAIAYATRATQIYEARTTIQIQEKEPDLPPIYRMLAAGSNNVATELQVLRSRGLVEDAVGPLGLQLVVTKPSGVPRSQIVRDVTIPRGATPDTFTVVRRPQGGFTVWRQSNRLRVDVPGPGRWVKLDSVSFVLAAEAANYPTVVLQVEGFEGTVARIAAGVSVSQPSRDAQILVVSYRDPDPQLVSQVPNALAHAFVEKRQQTQKTEARSTVAFLRKQLDTVLAQLSKSENALRQFREREQVVDAGAEASAQVNRYVALQAERSTIDAERNALTRLLDEVRGAADRRRPEEPSPYRRVLAFPTLLRNQAAADLARNLLKQEDDRAALLNRRTEDDPDVKALTARIAELEDQLKETIITYLQGLTNQSASLDGTLKQYRQQLARVPYRQLEVARLERQPEVLQQMYTLLQTKLKEAEIAQAVEDATVRVVDEAIPPLGPVSPQRDKIMAIGLFFGLLLGTALAFLREFLDRSVHSRSDVFVTTGLPVLGLIPRIPRRGRRFAVIAHRSRNGRGKIPLLAAPPALSAPNAGKPTVPGVRRQYTFLSTNVTAEEQPPPAARYEQQSGTLHRATPLPPVTIQGIGTAVTEAYGSLLTNLRYSSRERPLRTLVFTSALPKDGKTTNAVNLAFTLAQRGVRVILVDADLRRGAVQRLFEVSRTPGLSDVLNGTVSLPEALHVVEVEEGGALHVLTAGKAVLNPIATLESQAMSALLARLSEEFEAVILDTPPVNLLTDAAVLGAKADGVIIVVRASVTATVALEYAMQQLQLARATVVGVVLNDIDFTRDAAYDAVYRYHQYTSYEGRQKHD
jgi:capsular exopolysaccharide synthesis family protein